MNRNPYQDTVTPGNMLLIQVAVVVVLFVVGVALAAMGWIYGAGQ